jgi:hypothetical protein
LEFPTRVSPHKLHHQFQSSRTAFLFPISPAASGSGTSWILLHAGSDLVEALIQPLLPISPIQETPSDRLGSRNPSSIFPNFRPPSLGSIRSTRSQSPPSPFLSDLATVTQSVPQLPAMQY